MVMWIHACGGGGGGGGAGADLHPGLLMQVCDVELPARRMGHQLVMLLQNLVETLQGQHHGDKLNMESEHMGADATCGRYASPTAVLALAQALQRLSICVHRV